MRALIVLASLLALSACNGQNNESANDLLNAFQSGCTLNGGYLQLALNQTQSLATTIQDLENSKSCGSVNSALSTINNLQSQIASVYGSQYASQVSNLAGVQKILMLQMSQAKDPGTLSTLSSAYSSNLLTMAEAQSGMMAQQTPGLSSAGGPPIETPFQSGATQLNGYINQLFSDQSNLLQCAQDDPALAAQIGAGMIAVAGSFTPTVTGTALSLAGNVLSATLGFIHDSSYASALNQLNQVQMLTALPCGLEQMTDVYCQAQDVIDITHLEECAYNPSGADCPQPASTLSQSPAVMSPSTTAFWQGLDVLDRALPSLQLWLNQVVTGITPSDPYAAQQMNDAESAVSLMDNVSRLAQGVMKIEEVKISGLSSPSDQDKELRNALGILQSVLSEDSTNTTCVNSFGPGTNCQNTPILQTEGTATQVLYDLVNRNPNTDGCNPSSFTSQGCQGAASITLAGVQGSTDLQTWQNIEANAGGLPTLVGQGKDLIDATLERELALEHQVLDTDPSNLIQKVNTPVGEGLPSPILALHQVDAFLKSSYAFFSDPKQVPDSLLDGGAAMRPGILGMLSDTDKMVTDVITELGLSNGVNDLMSLTRIYNTFQLAKDRNYVYNRVLDRIKADLHIRIMAGQIPSSIYEILSQTEVDPTVGLTQIPPDQIETTFSSLGDAQVTAEANVEDYVSFFADSLNSALQFLKQQADSNGEPMTTGPTSPNRTQQAKICLLLVTSQNQWPDGVDVNLCKGLSYHSELTGESLDFNTFYGQLQSGSTKASQRMCSFYRFYRASEDFVHEGQGPSPAK